MTEVLEFAELVGRGCSSKLLVLGFDPNIEQRMVDVGLPPDFSSCGGVSEWGGPRTSVTGIHQTLQKQYIRVDIMRILVTCKVLTNFCSSLHSFISRVVWK